MRARVTWGEYRLPADNGVGDKGWRGTEQWQLRRVRWLSEMKPARIQGIIGFAQIFRDWAVAILLVVLFHVGFPGISGGYVGVDVFFVISGFVITGVLLPEHASTAHVSLVGFYGRRARRIIPAATVVIVATVIMAIVLLGPVDATSTAVDGQWASVFLPNFHFAASSTNYLASQLPPSPLQNFWSLAVEEQFYLIYPTLFLLVVGLFPRVSIRLGFGSFLVHALLFPTTSRL